MPSYNAPVDEVLFLLNDVFQIARHNNLPGFADASPDVVEAVLSEAGNLASEVLTPINRSGDIELIIRSGTNGATGRGTVRLNRDNRPDRIEFDGSDRDGSFRVTFRVEGRQS